MFKAEYCDTFLIFVYRATLPNTGVKFPNYKYSIKATNALFIYVALLIKISSVF